MKPTRKPLMLRKETVRNLSSTQLTRVAGALAPVDAPDSAWHCGTLISCAACTELRCIINTTVITSCG